MKRLIRTASTYVRDLDPKCRCGNYAVVFFEVHRWDNCLDEPTMASFMCAACRDRALKRLQRLCDRGGDVCLCGLRLVTPSDMIVRLEPLTKGKSTC